MKRLGPVSSFLGYNIRRDRQNRRTFIDQSAYVARILKKYGYNELTPVATPWLPKLVLPAPSPTHSADAMNQHQYITEGGLTHLIYGTRPDMAYTMNRLAEANQAPTEAHW